MLTQPITSKAFSVTNTVRNSFKWCNADKLNCLCKHHLLKSVRHTSSSEERQIEIGYWLGYLWFHQSDLFPCKKDWFSTTLRAKTSNDNWSNRSNANSVPRQKIKMAQARPAGNRNKPIKVMRCSNLKHGQSQKSAWSLIGNITKLGVFIYCDLPDHWKGSTNEHAQLCYVLFSNQSWFNDPEPIFLH